MGLMHRRDIPEVEVLRAARDRASGGPFLDEALSRYPSKVVAARLEQLSDRQLLEYGVSLRTAWLTEAGIARLTELEAT